MLHYVTCFVKPPLGVERKNFMNISDFFYTESQATKVLSVNRLTIWRWIKAGRFNIQRVGTAVLIPKWEVDLIKTQARHSIAREQDCAS